MLRVECRRGKQNLTIKYGKFTALDLALVFKFPSMAFAALVNEPDADQPPESRFAPSKENVSLEIDNVADKPKLF